MYFWRKTSIFAVVAVVLSMPRFAFSDAIIPSKAYVDDTFVPIAQGTGPNNANVGKALVVNSAGNLELGNVSVDISGKEDKSNKLAGTETTGQKIGDLAAGSADGQDQVMYPSAAAVKEYAIAKQQATTDSGKVLTVGANGVVTPQTMDALPTGTANQVLQYNGTNNEWEGVTMDSAPTASSAKPVTSSGVKTYVDNKITTTLTTSTTTAPSENTVKTAIDAKQTKPATVANGQVLTYSGTDANANVTAAYVKIPVATGAPSSNTPTAFSEVWIQ